MRALGTQLFWLLAFAWLAMLGMARSADSPTAVAPQKSLAEARLGFTTRLVSRLAGGEAVPEPPPALFRGVKYKSPAGELAAYVSVAPGDGKKHPAIIWIFGGFDSSIGEIAWQPGPKQNDQSASAFRLAGVLMMYPSMRGGNTNPGQREGFYGEVNDIVAAADFLAQQDYVDPKRIYLGGHSTGGTLALLVAEYTNRFRAVFAFGPVGDIRGYGQKNLPFRLFNLQEELLRSPAKWLHSIRNPTFVLEGTSESNIGELVAMSRLSRNPLVQFHPLVGADHFSGLAPVSRLIAEKVLGDTGVSVNIHLTPEELAAALKR